MGIPYAEVIGDPVAHSKSPVIHKFWLEKLGLEGDYRATRVSTGELAGYLEERRTDADWRGCNVTMPLKQDIMPLLDEIRDCGVGAVNCVVPRAGELIGSNTDSNGIDEVVDSWGFRAWSPDARICLIGAGGAVRGAIASLNIYTFDTFDLIARNVAKARALLESCGVTGEVHSFEDAGAAMVGRHAVINASPLGMVGFPPMPDEILDGLATAGREQLGFAFDMVTAPVRTAFVARAEEAGLIVSDGLTMLIGQARAAFSAFFGKSPPDLDADLRERLTS
jgi:shikimate dehydrogenase